MSPVDQPARSGVLKRRSRASWLRVTATVVLIALSSTATVSNGASAENSSKVTWVDQQVSITSGTMTIYATFRHPKGETASVPGVLLIAGSGPTDRNGNSTLIPGPVNTLKTLADWLSQDGVASLRYDKLGSGRTGLGPYAFDPASIGASVFEQEARSAFEFLAKEKGINDRELGVFGHSEGALFALLLATGHAGPTPPIHVLGLFEPLSQRYLDLLTDQIDANLRSQVRSGVITTSLEKTIEDDLKTAVAQLRTKGTVKANLPYGLANELNPTNARFWASTDKFDPEALAGNLSRGTPVLLTCSNDDTQVTCHEADRVARGLTAAGARLDFVHLKGVDHVLKVDASRTGANYAKNLPFSPQLRSALEAFTKKYL